MFDALRQHVEEDGYAIGPDAVPQELLRELDQALDSGHAGTRNLLSVPAVRELATSDPMRRLVEPVLGPNAFAVRGILFNKLPGANWKVAWHQDCAIAVREACCALWANMRRGRTFHPQAPPSACTTVTRQFHGIHAAQKAH
jgi:hypothetical protein